MTSRETMIVALQEETHVYAGDTGFVVVLQKTGYGEESSIFIDPHNVEVIIAAMKAAVPNAIEFRKEWREEAE